jgi:predicted DNA-binding mobile mystery protein A
MVCQNGELVTSDPRRQQRKQLSKQLKSVESAREVTPPDKGWIRAIRTTLGISSAELARRMGITRQAIADLERREADGTITIAKLRQAADALSADLRVLVLPRLSLKKMMRQRDEQPIQEETSEQP